MRAGWGHTFAASSIDGGGTAVGFSQNGRIIRTDCLTNHLLCPLIFWPLRIDFPQEVLSFFLWNHLCFYERLNIKLIRNAGWATCFLRFSGRSRVSASVAIFAQCSALMGQNKMRKLARPYDAHCFFVPVNGEMSLSLRSGASFRA